MMMMGNFRHLAAVQAVLQLLQSFSLCSQHPSNDRLLAEFLLLLAPTCKDAKELEWRCRLLTDELHEVCESTTFLELLKNRQEVLADEEILSAPKIAPESYNVNKEKESCSEKEPLISLRALEKANSTLEDFCRSYFMFHDMSAQTPHDLFKHLPMLAFVESYIYQIDEQKEERLLTRSKVSQEAEDLTFIDDQEDHFKYLKKILESRGLLTDRILKELRDGIEYWTLEHSLCNALLIDEDISLPDVMRAIKLKSFDYRVLNLLLYGLSHQRVNNLHMEFLSASEFLVEISDDLFDYEDDVLKNSFNILRMFIRIYGSAHAPFMLAQTISEAEEKYNDLLGKLEPGLSFQYQRRCQEAALEGGSSLTASPMGSWTIPPLILDEVEYRRRANSLR